MFKIACFNHVYYSLTGRFIQCKKKRMLFVIYKLCEKKVGRGGRINLPSYSKEAPNIFQILRERCKQVLRDLRFHTGVDEDASLVGYYA